MPETTVPQLSAADFAARMADMLPSGWCGQDAKAPGPGVVNAFLMAISTETAGLIDEINYALAAARIATETDPELTLASDDFFGPGNLPRPDGYTDAEYAAYIRANLFKVAVTRPAIQASLDLTIGSHCRLIEPWRIADTGVVDTAFLDIDCEAVPGRVGAPELRYQGYVEFAAAVDEQLALQGSLNAQRAFGTRVWLNLVATPPL